MKHLLSTLFIYLLLESSIVSAAVTPLVINSEFKTENWFPLPIEQMESAAVDASLMRISGFGEFAFLYKPDTKLAKKAGSLNFTVSLVEQAESAKITIRLSLPNDQGSYVSTSSISLSNKDYQGIFTALQQLGNDGATKLLSSLEAVAKSEEISDKEQRIRNQIVGLNFEIIDLRKEIKTTKVRDHNVTVMKELGKLDILISKMDAHHEYVKRSNEKTNAKLDVQHEYVKRSNEELNKKLDTQHEDTKRSNQVTNKKLDDQNDYAKRSDAEKNRKLNAIYSEISKLNIGSNTDNVAPGNDELTKYDLTQLPYLTKAREMKFDKNFDKARKILLYVLSDEDISLAFSKAVGEELDINLPLYEAEIVINELSSKFMSYTSNDAYKERLKYANNLYDAVLAQSELSLKKRIEINQKKDQLNLTGDSMSTAVTAMRASSLAMLSQSLRQAFYKNNAYRAMNIKGASDGPCPSREAIDVVLRKTKVNNPVVTYSANDESCKLILVESKDNLLVYVFNEVDSSYERMKR